MRRFRFIVVLLCAMMAVVGCHRRPLLEPDHRAVLKVKIRYDGIKNVTTGIYNDKIAVPELHTDVLRVLFYNEAGSRILSEGFMTEREVDADGNDIVMGNVMLAPGHYRVLAYNFDTPAPLAFGASDSGAELDCGSLPSFSAFIFSAISFSRRRSSSF